MDSQAYSLYYPDHTYTDNTQFSSCVLSSIATLQPLIMQNLKQISQTQRFSCPFDLFLEITIDYSDYEKKLNIISISVSQILKEQNYGLIYIRIVLTDYDSFLLNNNIEINKSHSIKIPRFNKDSNSQLVYFKGSIFKSSPPKPFLHFITYKCSNCNFNLKRNNDESKIKLCKCKKAEISLNEASNIISDYQEFKIRDEIDLDCIFWHGENRLGDEIEGIGLVKMKSCGNGEFKKIIDVISHKKCNLHEKEKNDLKKEFSESLENSLNNKSENFKSFKEDENLLEKLCKHLFNDIYGYENIKTALILSLFSGSNSNIQPSIHLFLIGDPGLGKSKLLTKMSKILSKSLYTCATTCTSAGLTLSCFDNENITAGCVALCNNGICCIDELDKLKDAKVLYEVMNDGTMTYNKGGLYYQMKVNTTIIAACNPKGGTYKKEKSLLENVKFEKAFLERFDLIFVMFEEFNEEKMRKIINMKTDKNLDDNFFNEKEILDYIIYCRENINPILSSKAKQKLKDFWVDSRKENKSIQLLLALKRLTEAKAKINMRVIAGEKDAEFAIDLYKKTIVKEKKKGKFLDEFKDRKGTIISKNEIEEMMKIYKVNKNVDDYIEKLNYQGLLIKKEKDTYKIL
ncbi:DNA replication licensing factor mcm8 [Gurleya vavrai]